MWRAGLPILALAALLAACGRNPPPPPPPAAPDFVSSHWQRPLPPNGPAPAGFTPAEASLDPAACGECHPQQFEDWKSALHSRAMGPGLFGQLQAMGPQARDEHQACLQCHAPLAEQADDLVRTLSGEIASHAQGLTCAGCHVRGHVRYGPPRRDGSSPTPGLPHAGWRVEKAFSDSRFCAACHQFEADGPSLNGKPLENTYEEWRASRHAKEGRTCQSCHMPDRRHLWRGIHDPEMVKSGLGIETSSTVVDGQIRAELLIANTGAGHAFPTYVTPRVHVEICQEDGRGRAIAGAVERHLIARDVSLDLAEERADTRLLPDEKRRYAYDRPRDPRAAAVRFRVTVEPDAFYADFYRAVLDDPAYAPGSAALREALRRAENSAFTVFEARKELGRGTP